MKKVLLLLCMVSLFVGCADEADPEAPIELTKAELLASEESKVWFLFAITPDDDSCPGEEVFLVDNTWTFLADGTFEFDHGTVTEVPDCDDCCGDAINLTGAWEISEDGTEFNMYILYATGDPDNVFPDDENEFFNGTIVSLEENKMIFSQMDEGVEYTIEFRPVE